MTVEEENVLHDNATPAYLQDIIVFALHTGCRRGEILSCRWKENIDMRSRTVTIQATKRGKLKVIPMSKTLYQLLLKRSRTQNISGRVFSVGMLAMKDAFERSVRKSELQNLHFHDLRHTFATRLAQAGVDLYSISKLMGHKSIKMTERYAHHCPSRLRPSVKALDEYYNSNTVETEGEQRILALTLKDTVLSIGHKIGSA